MRKSYSSSEYLSGIQIAVLACPPKTPPKLIRPAKLVRSAVEKMAWHGRLVPVFPAV